MFNKQINLNGKMVYDYNKSGKSLIIATYVALSYHYPHKKIHFGQIPNIAKKLGKSENTVREYFTLLKKENLITRHDSGFWQLSSIKQNHEKYGGKFQVSCFVPQDVIELGVKAIKFHLQLLAIPSNGIAQIKAIETKQHFLQISNALQSKNGRVTTKDRTALRRYLSKPGTNLVVNPKLSLAISGVKRLTGLSNKTAIKARRFLTQTNICHFERQYKVHLTDVSLQDIMDMKETCETAKNGRFMVIGTEYCEQTEQFTKFELIPMFAKYHFNTRTLYSDSCSTFNLTYRSSNSCYSRV